MILFSIIIGLGIISILARIIVYILNTILDSMSKNDTSVQARKSRKKKSNGCLHLIVSVILLLILFICIGYNQYNSYQPNRKPNNSKQAYSSSPESVPPNSLDHSYRSPNERSYRWIYDDDTGIGYHSGESQCSVLSLEKHTMGSHDPHWVTFMITKYDSGAVRLIVSDGLYDHMIGNQSVRIEFDHGPHLSLTSSKDGVKLVMYTNDEMIDRMKASKQMTIPVLLDNQTTETLHFDLSNFKKQCPY